MFAVVALVQRNRAEENELAAEQARIEAEANAAEALRQEGIAKDQTRIAEENAEEALRASQLARSRELAAAAIATIDEDPQLSILLALEAADMADPPPASIEALHRAVQSQQLIYEIQLEPSDWFEDLVAVAEWSLSPDGARIAMTTEGARVEVIDIKRDAVVTTYSIPEDSLIGLDGSTLAMIKALESEGQPTPEASCRNMFGPMSMQSVSFSPNGSLVATVLGDGRLHVFDAETAERLDLGVPRIIDSFDSYCYPYATVDFTPDGSGVVVAVRYLDDAGFPDFNQISQIWAVDGSGLIAELPMVLSGASIDISADNRWAVSSQFWTRGIAVDDLTGQEARQEVVTGSEIVFDAAFVPEGVSVAGSPPDGLRVITARRYNMVQVWDVGTQQQIGWFEGPETTVDVSPSGVLVGAGFDGTVHAWDLASGSPIATLVGHDGVIWDVEISADGTTVASGPDGQGRIKVWDIGGVSRAEVAGTMAPGRRTTRIDAIEDVVAVLTREDVTDPGSLMLYDLESLDVIAEVPDQFGFALRLTAEGTVISQVSVFGRGGWSEPLETDVVIRPISNQGQPMASIPTHTLCESAPDAVHDEGAGCSEYWVFTREIDTDGRLLAVAGSDATSVWDIATETLVTYWTFDEGYLNGVRFSPDGDLLVVGSGANVRVYVVGAWEEPIALLTGFDYTVQYMDFSPDSSLLAIQASESNHLTVWNTKTWELEYELREHQGGVTDLDFSPDGRWLVTAGIDGTARVYDALTGGAMSLLPTPGDGERYVRFAASNSSHLVVASESGVVSVLTLDREELMEIARDKLFRGFTVSECERFALGSCDAEP